MSFKTHVVKHQACLCVCENMVLQKAVYGD